LVQSDTSQYWKARLTSKLKTDASLSCQAPLEDIDLIFDLSDMSVSQHLRTDSSVISLYHVFLDCKA
jgi:hypothetical protein